MSLAVILTRARLGITAPEVLVEVHLSNGLPALNIVGLPETVVRESKDRVRSALLNAGFEFPSRRITVNLSPVDIPKEGGRFDLPIALGILLASGQLPKGALDSHECLGELSLGGELRKVPGVLPAVVAATKAGRKIILPESSAKEAQLCSHAEVLCATSLQEITAHFHKTQPISPLQPRPQKEPDTPGFSHDLAAVKGHFQAKRALEIAAAGGHGLLMSGPPGTGKTMLAQCLPELLPSLSEQHSLEVASIYSLNGKSLPEWGKPPLRAPHHTASCVALTGGGTHPRPGEISLAHRGVLFLDELPEFERRSLEVLRQPLESGEIHISRARHQLTFPARFQLVAAMNPCPCGFLGDKEKPCHCTPEQVQRYRRKLSGPLMDRIDMHIEVTRLPPEKLLDATGTEESSENVSRRVRHVREMAQARQRCLNSEVPEKILMKQAALGDVEKQLLGTVLNKLQLSGRGLHKLMRVARTIADLDGQNTIRKEHLVEALSFRQLHM